MKINKLLICIPFLGLFLSLNAQVTTSPTAFIKQDRTEEFDVIFDASSGNEAMLGETECYAHTGVITTASKGDNDWKHAPVWLDNSDKYKMTKIDESRWNLHIEGGMRQYYNLAENEVVTKLAFVFRNADGTKEGKTASGNDILYVLFNDDELAVKITSLNDGSVYEQGETISIDAEASESSNMKLTVNGIVKSEISSNLLTYDYALTGSGYIPIKVTAEIGGEEVSDSLAVYVKSPVVDEPVPAGMKEGINKEINGDVATITLVFRAPFNNNVYVIGDFNDWSMNEAYQMKRDSVWTKSVLEPSQDSLATVLFWCSFDLPAKSEYYSFQYLVDGSLQISDPYAEIILDPWNDPYIKKKMDSALPAYPTGKGDGLVSVLWGEDPTPYEWQNDFQIADKDNLVIYELHIRDFVSSSDLAGVMSKLDYLEHLGINAIELMPINEFDGNDSWGYNPNHFFATDKAYGTRNEYKEFIDECHRRGIAVILDMVFNHATGINPMAKLYYEGNATSDINPWFNKIAKHPYNVFHDINHEYTGTRQFFKRVLSYWLEEYRVDGFRMDLTKGLTQKNSGNDVEKWGKYDASRIAIIKDYYDTLVATNPNAIFILEHLSEYNEEKVLSDYGMFPWRNMNNSYCQAAMGYASNSNFVDTNGKGGMFTTGWVGYAESHDEERNMYKALAYGDGNLKENEDARLARVPLMIAFAQLIPGPKMMWEFEEMGYDYSINTCSDGQIKEECRTYRKPVPWTLNWDEDALRMNAYNQSSKVINLRTDNPEFFEEGNVVLTNCATSSFVKVRRIDINYVDEIDVNNSVDIIVLGNFDAKASVTTSVNYTKTGTWYDYMTDEAFNVTRLSKTITLAPGEFKILTSRHISHEVGVNDVESDGTGHIVFPTITDGVVYVQAPSSISSIKVFNLQGSILSEVKDASEISLSNCPSGNYILQVISENGTSIHRIIKK